MRRVLPFDVEQAAFALLGYGEHERSMVCNRWIEQAELAHRYFKSFGEAHALWGTGALAEVVPRFRVTLGRVAARDRYSAVEVVFRCLTNK